MRKEIHVKELLDLCEILIGSISGIDSSCIGHEHIDVAERFDNLLEGGGVLIEVRDVVRQNENVVGLEAFRTFQAGRLHLFQFAC